MDINAILKIYAETDDSTGLEYFYIETLDGGCNGPFKTKEEALGAIDREITEHISIKKVIKEALPKDTDDKGPRP